MFKYLCAPIFFYLSAVFGYLAQLVVRRRKNRHDAKWFHDVTQEAMKEYLEGIKEKEKYEDKT